MSGIAVVIFLTLLLAGRVSIRGLDIKNALTVISVTLVGGLVSIGGVKFFSFSASLRRDKERVERILAGLGCPFVPALDESARRRYQISSPTNIRDRQFCLGCFLVDHNGRTDCRVSPLYQQ